MLDIFDPLQGDIDGDIDRCGPKPIYGYTMNLKELWVSLLEKVRVHSTLLQPYRSILTLMKASGQLLFIFLRVLLPSPLCFLT